MKTDFLKSLGISEQSVIDQIMAEMVEILTRYETN